jgi:hypothetical protein
VSTQTDFFRSQTNAAKHFARLTPVRLPDGSLDRAALHAALVKAEAAERGMGGCTDLGVEMAEETRQGVLRHTLIRDADRRRKGLHVGTFHQDRDALWLWLLPRSLRQAAWLAWQPGADGVVDVGKLRAWCEAAVAAYRSRPGMASEHDEHEAVIAAQVAHRSQFKKKRRNRPAAMRAPSRTRSFRRVLRLDVSEASSVRDSEWSSFGDVPVGAAIHDRVVGRDRFGRPLIRRVRDGSLSVEQVRSRVAAHRAGQWAVYYAKLDRGQREHPVYNPRPFDLDVRITKAAVRTAMEAMHGKPSRDARLQRLAPLERDAATFLKTVAKPRSVVAVAFNDLLDKIHERSANANTRRSQRLRMGEALRAIEAGGCGLHVTVAGARKDVVLVGMAGRRIPADVIAKADSLKPLRLVPGLASMRAGNVEATAEGQDAACVMRSLGLSRASSDSDLLRTVELLGYSPSHVVNHRDWQGSYDDVTSWGEILTEDFVAGPAHELGQALTALSRCETLSSIWRIIAAGPVFQAGMKDIGDRVDSAIVQAIQEAFDGCGNVDDWQEALAKARLRCTTRGRLPSENPVNVSPLPITRLKGMDGGQRTSRGQDHGYQPSAPPDPGPQPSWASSPAPPPALVVPAMPRMRSHAAAMRSIGMRVTGR